MVDFLAEVDTPATSQPARSLQCLRNPGDTTKKPGLFTLMARQPRQVQGQVKGGFQLERLARGLEVGSIRRIQGIGYGVLEFLGVGTTFDIFQNIHILYLQYGVLTSSGYGVLIFFPLWSLVSAGTDTPYLP
ncbi:hypothetical protein Tco_1555530 [Tanacetum coccineum]